MATIDDHIIGSWPLVSFTPFTVTTANFTVTFGGLHNLKFAGTISGDHTAFFSGVSITTTNSLAVNRSSALPGRPVIVSAAGFSPSEPVAVYGYGSVKAVLAEATADANGKMTVAARIPQTPFGNYGLQAIGSSSGRILDGNISIKPETAVNPRTGIVGDTLTVQGFGFAAGEAVFVSWLTPQTSLGSSKTGGDGSFPAFTFAIPSGASPGSNTVMAMGQRSGAIAVARIVVH